MVIVSDLYRVRDRVALFTAVVHKVIESREKPMYAPKVRDCGSTAKWVTWDDSRSCGCIDTDPAAESAPV